jgi:hypothetical protein
MQTLLRSVTDPAPYPNQSVRSHGRTRGRHHTVASAETKAFRKLEREREEKLERPKRQPKEPEPELLELPRCRYGNTLVRVGHAR